EDRLHCFAWDDAQAMDAATLDAILTSAGRPGSTPASLRAVFMLVTRDTPHESFAGHAQHHHLALGELSDDDSARLISTRVAARPRSHTAALGVRTPPPAPPLSARGRGGPPPFSPKNLKKDPPKGGAPGVRTGPERAPREAPPPVPPPPRPLTAARVPRLDPA